MRGQSNQVSAMGCRQGKVGGKAQENNDGAEMIKGQGVKKCRGCSRVKTGWKNTGRVRADLLEHEVGSVDGDGGSGAVLL